MLMSVPMLLVVGPVPAAEIKKHAKRSRQQPAPQSDRTSLLLKNLPNNISRQGLMELFDSLGFKGCYNFLYMPMDFERGANLGYAFLNLTSGLQGERFARLFQGFSAWPSKFSSKKVTEIQWNTAQRGVADHIERYRNSPLFHRSVPEEWRPLLLRNGVPVAFPPPTRILRKPQGRSAQKVVSRR
jgi:RNA recognition motif-containing protein